MSSWWCYRGDPQRSGANVAGTPTRDPRREIRWSVNVINGHPLENGLRSDPRGHIYVGRSDGLSVLDQRGKQVWRYTDVTPECGLFVREGVVLAGHDGIHIVRNGEKQVEVETNLRKTLDCGGALLPFLLEDFGYIESAQGSDSMEFCAWPKDGGFAARAHRSLSADNEDFFLTVQRIIPPLVHGIYFRYDSRATTASIGRLTHDKPVYPSEDMRQGFGEPIVHSDGTLFVTEYDPASTTIHQFCRLTRIQGNETGLRSERIDDHSYFAPPPVVTKNDVYYIKPGKILAKRTIGGGESWETSLDDYIDNRVSMIRVVGDIVYIVSDRTLVGFEEFGENVFSLSFDYKIKSVIGTGNGVYVATTNSVFAFTDTD